MALSPGLTIEDLWRSARFTPNDEQRDAILHVDGPLYLTAGPGSGKTRVLLWRTLNLLVFCGVRPDEIFLSTFTEKAALQLREGLQALLGEVTNRTGRPFDLTQMYVGTVHSLCQRLITDRRFAPDRQRRRPPTLLDELGQYFHVSRRRTWRAMLAGVGLDADNGGNTAINRQWGSEWDSAHEAARNCIALFNRMSEECLDPADVLRRLEARDAELGSFLAEHEIDPDGLALLVRLYAQYRASLRTWSGLPLTDFSLLQQEAHEVLRRCEDSGRVFRHVIVDEYQDTNTIQERLFFKLAAGSKNLCVVGDDDQALYRFRGATVENFVQFPERCREHLGVEPRRIPLSVNYRSRQGIVRFYSRFMDGCDWSRDDGAGHYRVDKDLRAARADEQPSVVTTCRAKADECCEEIARLVCRLIDERKVQDANQIAFLFPSVKYQGQMNTYVRRMKVALERQGLKVYAPRAGRFLEVDEATEMLGMLGVLFEPNGLGGFIPGGTGSWNAYRTWLHNAKERARKIIDGDTHLANYIRDRREELQTVVADYQALMGVVESWGWDLHDPYDVDRMKRPLLGSGLGGSAARALASAHFEAFVRHRAATGAPISLRYVIRRATSLDWSVLDAFYRICGADHFRRMFALAEQGVDEGPICNLALTSQYLARFQDEGMTLITGDLLVERMFQRVLFGRYLYAIYRLGESEYENSQDPFPKGRVPFLTIHQSKGLEFPVVVLVNPCKRDSGPQRVEKLVRPFLSRPGGEPLGRMSQFDIMRMFYVALSRAQNLLVIARPKGTSIYRAFQGVLDELPELSELDLDTVPEVGPRDERLPKVYSYTGDYLAYTRCPRQYMIFRKYGFAPSQTRTMVFGSLVHRTLDDLHNYLIDRRKERSP